MNDFLDWVAKETKYLDFSEWMVLIGGIMTALALLILFIAGFVFILKHSILGAMLYFLLLGGIVIGGIGSVFS